MSESESVERLAQQLAEVREDDGTTTAFLVLVAALKSLPSLPEALSIDEAKGEIVLQLPRESDGYRLWREARFVASPKGLKQVVHRGRLAYMGSAKDLGETEYILTPQEFNRALLAAYAEELSRRRHPTGQLRAVQSGLPTA
jgi:hypothetical protein